MLVILKRLIYTLSNKIWQKKPGSKHGLHAPESKFTVDFSNPVLSKEKKSLFNIKSEISYNANLLNDSLKLGLKKSNCIAWIDIPEHEYQEHVIEAKIRLDSLEGYAAAGIIFRIMDDTSYYLALVSSKGYFRLDVVKDNVPRPLIAWTEIHSDFDGTNIKLKIVTYGTYLIFIVNDKWLGEANDDTISHGRLGFALASYTENDEEIKEQEEYTSLAYLDYISIDTRIKVIEDSFKKWTDDSNIDAVGRLRLAETFAVMGESSKSLEQINRAWKRRDEAIRSVATAYTEVRTRKELLLAARMSYNIGLYNEAEEFIDMILDTESDTAEKKLAYTEKLKILNELNKFKELKEFIIKHPFKINKDIYYYTILARCQQELKNYTDSAEAWDKACEINKENGIFAVNAANAHELAGNKKEAIKRYVNAGKIFLNQDNRAELSALMPKLMDLGSNNWEARALAGKWAYILEDYDKSACEFVMSNKIRCALKPRPKADPASYYLWALILNMKGKKSEAIRLLERAVKLAPGYELFQQKLAELNG